MKSPFPGMDPYLEQHWRDVHAGLVMYSRDYLQEQLPANLVARVEERVVFEADEEVEPWVVVPDVKITERIGAASSSVATAPRKASVSEPIVVEYDGPWTETFIQILEAGPRQRLVTVIEVLSPSNKLPGDGRTQYRRKQRELRDARVSLVEIDLLRRGKRLWSVPADLIPRRARAADYVACVQRGWLSCRQEIYPIPLREPLPTIRIPLRQKNEDIHLDLQSVVEEVYRKARYHLTIAYDEPPVPPLSAADAKWAKGLVGKIKKQPKT